MTTRSANHVDSRYARRAAISSLVGTTIEWYDFFLYGTSAALIFSKAFFAPLAPSGQQILAYLTLAIGFAARPLGGVLLGHFGDRIGRKSTLVVSLFLMGTATVAIGLLPTYETVGVWAPILLVLCRLVQGVAIGGEWGGAVLLAVEAAPPHRRRFYGAFPQIGTPLGLLLANVVVLIVSSTLTNDDFLSWGWRIPFLASIVLVAVGFVIRMSVPETPAFLAAAATAPALRRIPIAEVVTRHRRRVVHGILILIGHSAATYVVLTFSLDYGTRTLGYSRGEVLGAVLVVAALWIVSIPFWAKLADRIGLRRVFLIGMVTLVVAALAYLPLLDLRSTGWLFLASTIMGLTLPIAHNGHGSLLADFFPTRVRYSGASLTYQFGALLGGGLAPSVATALLLVSVGQSWAVTLYVVVLVLLSTTAAARIPNAPAEPISPAAAAIDTGTRTAN